MNNPDHISESQKTIFWVKILKFFDANPGFGMEKFGSGLRDGMNSYPGSGLNIPDPQHWLTRCPVSIQSCKWNERSLNRGRGLGIDETFFWDSCSNLEIDENVRISHKLGLGLAEKFSKTFAIQLDRYRGQYTIITITIQIIPSLMCFPGFMHS